MDRDTFFKKLEGKINPENIELISLAYRFTKYGHKNQKRDNEERYFEHPRRVALILIDELCIYDYEVIIAALLHDIIEDSFILTFKDIGMIFGKRIMQMVEILSKVSIENKIFKIKKRKVNCYIDALQTAEKEIKIIKLADRLDNLRTLHVCDMKKIRKIIKETEEIYLFLAKNTNNYLYNTIKSIINCYKKAI